MCGLIDKLKYWIGLVFLYLLSKINIFKKETAINEKETVKNELKSKVETSDSDDNRKKEKPDFQYENVRPINTEESRKNGENSTHEKNEDSSSDLEYHDDEKRTARGESQSNLLNFNDQSDALEGVRNSENSNNQADNTSQFDISKGDVRNTGQNICKNKEENESFENIASVEKYTKDKSSRKTKVKQALDSHRQPSREKADEQYVYFWKSHSPYSQWYPSEFTVDGIAFNCAEQYMMYSKALLFKDQETADRVISELEPREQKQLGRLVKNFDQKLWDEKCLQIVKRGNSEKFSQNKELKARFLQTHPKTFVEASPYDKIWGIGLEEDDPRAWDEETWRGKNLLGKALTEVRNELFTENVSNQTSKDFANNLDNGMNIGVLISDRTDLSDNEKKEKNDVDSDSKCLDFGAVENKNNITVADGESACYVSEVNSENCDNNQATENENPNHVEHSHYITSTSESVQSDLSHNKEKPKSDNYPDSYIPDTPEQSKTFTYNLDTLKQSRKENENPAISELFRQDSNNINDLGQPGTDNDNPSILLQTRTENYSPDILEQSTTHNDSQDTLQQSATDNDNSDTLQQSTTHHDNSYSPEESRMHNDNLDTLEQSRREALEKFEFFWKSHSPYCQWYLSEFTEGGITFNCAEQFMMYSKAMLFEDEDTALQVLNEKEPREQKQLGRMVKNFDQRLWDVSCFDIVKRGNRAKFLQNKELKARFLQTHPKTFVEASPYDRIWGIGLEEDDPRAWDKETWRGKNLLGNALTEVRNEFIKEGDSLANKYEKGSDTRIVDAQNTEITCAEQDLSVHKEKQKNNKDSDSEAVVESENAIQEKHINHVSNESERINKSDSLGARDSKDSNNVGTRDSKDSDSVGTRDSEDGDGDGIPDSKDSDSVGTLDSKDSDSLDPSQCKDSDSLGTGYSKDSDSFGTRHSKDSDGDGIPDSKDSDGDGIPNNKDSDDDGIPDIKDSDGDGIPDSKDSESLGTCQSKDSDNVATRDSKDSDDDGITDNKDSDGYGTLDSKDTNKTEEELPGIIGKTDSNRTESNIATNVCKRGNLTILGDDNSSEQIEFPSALNTSIKTTPNNKGIVDNDKTVGVTDLTTNIQTDTKINQTLLNSSNKNNDKITNEVSVEATNFSLNMLNRERSNHQPGTYTDERDRAQIVPTKTEDTDNEQHLGQVGQMTKTGDINNKKHQDQVVLTKIVDSDNEQDREKFGHIPKTGDADNEHYREVGLTKCRDADVEKFTDKSTACQTSRNQATQQEKIGHQEGSDDVRKKIPRVKNTKAARNHGKNTSKRNQNNALQHNDIPKQTETAHCAPSGKEKSKKRRGGKFSGLQNSSRDEANGMFEFFWKSYSPYSQWYKSTFTVDSVTFNCAEQFMMYSKAILFNDKEIADTILQTYDPKEQKKLGRRVQNFDQKTWDAKCFNLVKHGNMAKFSQNEDLKKIILKTSPKTLVEASPCDKIWGIGLPAESPKAWNRETWKGRNLLGQALTEVRDELQKDNLFSSKGSTVQSFMDGLKTAKENNQTENQKSKTWSAGSCEWDKTLMNAVFNDEITGDRTSDDLMFNYTSSGGGSIDEDLKGCSDNQNVNQDKEEDLPNTESNIEEFTQCLVNTCTASTNNDIADQTHCDHVMQTITPAYKKSAIEDKNHMDSDEKEINKSTIEPFMSITSTSTSDLTRNCLTNIPVINNTENSDTSCETSQGTTTDTSNQKEVLQEKND